MNATALYRLYRGASRIALPFLARREVNKLRKAGFDVDRAHEKLGHATESRPLGPLIWFHGASVGEAKSVLHLIARITATDPGVQVLLTSGTATSAAAVAPRLPERTRHQFAPLDGIGPITRFLDHWRPDLAVLVESELWPNMLDALARREIPLVLLNARLSDRSAAQWQKWPDTARYLLRGVRLVLAQDRRTLDNLRALGLDPEMGLNVKSVLGPPLVDEATLEAARRALDGRPVWAAVSTHPGEEEIVLGAHETLLSERPDLCLILVPRHPDRADAIQGQIETRGLSVARRGTGGALADGAQVYLADTLGETDLWYALCPIIFLGGSLVPVGGHTPFEPAAAGCAILHGPAYANFEEVYADFLGQSASIQVADGAELTAALRHLFHDDPARQALAEAARPLSLSDAPALDALASRLRGLVDA